MFARCYAFITGFDAVLGVLVQLMIHGVSPLVVIGRSLQTRHVLLRRYIASNVPKNTCGCSMYNSLIIRGNV
jgi:hypothetical protein